MNLIKRLITTIAVFALLTTLTACGSYTSKAKNNINAYMKTMKNLTTDNFVSWVSENLGNPYSEYGVEFEQLKQGQIAYFINCLSKVKYEIINIDETNKMAEVKVTYVDSTEYISELFGQLISYVFSEDYTEEGENQLYIDVMNSITEENYVEDTIYFGLHDDGTIGIATSNTFDVATAGLYKIMLVDPSGGDDEDDDRLSADDLIPNIDVSYEILNDTWIFVTITNNNDVAISPLIRFVFTDSEGNYVIESQAIIDALPAGATNFALAYNELGDDSIADYYIEKEVYYYNDEDIAFFDESLISLEIKPEEERDDQINVLLTNNTTQTINLCGGFIVYDEQGDIMDVGTIYCENLEPGQTDCSWFYLPSDYDEATDTITVTQTYGHIDVFPIAHTYADAIWAS